MKISLLLFITFLSSIIGASVQAQQKVYYLVDTIDVSPNNRIVSIGLENGGSRQKRYYQFFCRCIKKHKYLYPIFQYTIPRGEIKFYDKPPVGRYLSWKELESALHDHQENFDGFYLLTIVEKQPNSQFIQNEVRLYMEKRLGNMPH